MIERNHNVVSFDLHFPIQRTAVFNALPSVQLGLRPQCQPFADVLLIRGMDVPRLADVDDHGHAGVLEPKRHALRLAQSGPLTLRGGL